MFDVLHKKYPVLLPLAIALVLFTAHLGLTQTNIMEARNLITAREMVQDGNWIFTTLNGEPRYEKPPLPTWITAITGLAAGFDNMFWLRLPAALVGLLLVFYFFKLAQAMGHSNRQSSYASVILASSFYIFFSARDNQWDIYCHAFTIIAIYYLYRSVQTSRYLPALWGALFLGCSFLSKGPVSLYALFLPFILAFLLHDKNARAQWPKTVLVLVLGLAVGMSWPLYVRFFDSTEFMAATQQEATRWGGYNTRPFYYYWSFFTQSGIWTLPAFTALLYPYLAKRVSNIKRYQFAISWTLLSLFLLSVIPEKKTRYLLPVLIPLALNTSFYIEFLVSQFTLLRNKWEKSWTYFVFGLIAVLAFALPIIMFVFVSKDVSSYAFWLIASLLACWAMAFGIIYGLAKNKIATSFWSIVGLMMAVFLFAYPVSASYYNNPDFFGGEKIRSLEQQYGIKTYELNGFVPEIVWEYGKSIKDINSDGGLQLPAEKRFGLILNSEDSALLKNLQVEKIGQVDVNHVPSSNRSYNKRIVRQYYLVTQP